MKKLFYLLLTMLLLATSLLAGCGNNTQESAKKDGQLHIVTSFYPMYIATANITKGVEGVQLTNMTKPQTGCLHDYHDCLCLDGSDFCCYYSCPARFSAVLPESELLLVPVSQPVS